jgi:hypothetical protein
VIESQGTGVGTAQRAGQVATQETDGTAERARAAATEVAGVVAEKGRAVTGEAVAQARQVTDELRQRVSSEAHSQAHRAAEAIRQWSDDLASMVESSKPDSPVRGMVAQVADGGRRAAGYLDEQGFGAAFGQLQRFARRRPGSFLAGAALAGFAVGRIAKATVGASQSGGEGEASSPHVGQRL